MSDSSNSRRNTIILLVIASAGGYYLYDKSLRDAVSAKVIIYNNPYKPNAKLGDIPILKPAHVNPTGLVTKDPTKPNGVAWHLYDKTKPVEVAKPIDLSKPIELGIFRPTHFMRKRRTFGNW